MRLGALALDSHGTVAERPARKPKRSVRQAEFGVLNALGFTRWQLVWRVVRETAATIVAAWLLSVVLCAAGLLYMQFGLYAPLGFRLGFFNPTPWLFTRPSTFRKSAPARCTSCTTRSWNRCRNSFPG